MAQPSHKSNLLPVHKGQLYKCAWCKGTFKATRSHESAVDDLEKEWPKHESPVVVICDDCHTAIIRRIGN